MEKSLLMRQLTVILGMVIIIIVLLLLAWFGLSLYKGNPTRCVQDSDCVLSGSSPPCVSKTYFESTQSVPWSEWFNKNCKTPAIRIKKPNSTLPLEPYPYDQACKCVNNNCEKQDLSSIGWFDLKC